ncbi:MAG TPA: nucleotidyltransferase domain-containing protein [Cyclobacteriaceae bacterium]|nr:nucleotidyltransferase domain-containing protein [Cyclobacteriaceae bacterium]
MNKELLHQSIVKTLLYYDIFNYPLRANEVFRFLPTNSVKVNDVEHALENLSDNKLIYRFGEYFSIQNSEQNVVRRRKGNNLAEKYASIAHQRAKLIARFPFVRAVFASGSFSKGYMDEKSDLDFFIITAPGRLWMARTLIVMFKRLFFFNSHKYFCCNYFIDSEHLEIEEKNLFTATELATLVPLCGSRLYSRMINNNSWVMDFFPNYEVNSVENSISSKPSFLKISVENILNTKLFDRIEKFFMRITLARWKRLYERKYNAKDFNIAFKSSQHVSKNHPNHYQQKVMRCYDEKIRNYNQLHESHLAHLA